ncbi:hypothetical protein HVZ29_00525 [Escherichia coli]|nr:hypothetical protein HVZ29_00525 [Escherichia coli]
MAGNGSSEGQTAVQVCISDVMVSNAFERMILIAHRAQGIILKMREKSLIECVKNKNGAESREFESIFGVRADKKIKGDVTALMIMQDGVRRIKSIHTQMIRAGKDGKMTCYYLNNTICGGFSARVNEFLDRDYKIYIAHKFIGINVTGSNSQVGILSHEMSHFTRTGIGGINGGMGTGDLNANGEEAFLSEKGHIAAANEMVRNHSKRVFNSAYNIERYFEVPLNNVLLSEITEVVEDDMKKELKIITDNTPPPEKK